MVGKLAEIKAGMSDGALVESMVENLENLMVVHLAVTLVIM
jgi:hypothetical protein